MSVRNWLQICTDKLIYSATLHYVSFALPLFPIYIVDDCIVLKGKTGKMQKIILEEETFYYVITVEKQNRLQHCQYSLKLIYCMTTKSQIDVLFKSPCITKLKQGTILSNFVVV